jgi:hypothetical protein
MRLSVVFLALALTAPVSAFAQLSVHYELNEEGLATAQALTLKRNQVAVLKAAPGEQLTAVDLPAATGSAIVVEKRYWYSAEVNWNEKGIPLGYRRPGKWVPAAPDRQHRIQLGYEKGTPPAFDGVYWKKARASFVAHANKPRWTDVASRCAGPVDMGTWGNGDGAYCNISADAVELRVTETVKGRKQAYDLTYMFSGGR